MAAKTLDEFIKEYRSGFNPITGQQNLFKDLTDEMVWNAAIKSVEEKFNSLAQGGSTNKQSTPCKCAQYNMFETTVFECKDCGKVWY